MNILLTGCAGFIGSRICELLLQDGHNVYGIDNYCDSYDEKLKHFRVKGLNSYDNFRFYECDISDNSKLTELFDEIKEIKAVMNLAARAGVRQSMNNPWIYYNTNVIGTLNLLEICKNKGIKKFVLASTSSIYGENKPPFNEDSNTDRQLSQYASSKKAAENLCYIYHKNYDMDFSILRYFTVYGPAGRPDMSIFRFVKWISEDIEIELYGDGNQIRDYTYVDDVARGSIIALKELGYEIINLGSGKPVTINDTIKIIEDELGKSSKIIYKEKHPADIDATSADITKAKNLLNWTPQVNLKTGIVNSINWYKDNIELASKITI